MPTWPIWHVLKLGIREDATIEEARWPDIESAWAEWKAMSDAAAYKMSDLGFNWERECAWARDWPLSHVAGLRAQEGVLLGLLSYREATFDRGLKTSYMSVRPDCRTDWPGDREFSGVGTCLIAFAAYKGEPFPLELGEVLPNAGPFFLSLGAETIGTTPDNESIMRLPVKAGRSLIKSFMKDEDAD